MGEEGVGGGSEGEVGQCDGGVVGVETAQTP